MERIMLLKRSGPAILAAIFLTLQVAVAQVGSSVARQVLQSDDAGIVIGQPCMVVEKTASARPLADGTTITKNTEERKWRDSEGRFRKEATTVEEGESPVFHSATIIDPVKNTLTILNLDSKVATVIHLPEQGPGQLHKYIELDEKPLEARPGVEVRVEKLKEKSIAGENAVGRRVTRTRPPGTIGNDKPVVSVSERWVSPELKILLASSMDDPREKQTREVTQLQRTEPESNLFTIPSDFVVKDIQARDPQR